MEDNFKFLYFSDAHLFHRSPFGRCDDFPNVMLDKLSQVINIANEKEVDAILFGGDLFQKSVVATEYLSKVARILRSSNSKIYVICGNHDIKGHNISTIETTSLGVLINSEVLSLLEYRDNKYLEIKISDKTVIIEGAGYEPSYDLNIDNYNVHKRGDFNLLLVHGMMQENPILESIEHTLTSSIQNPANVTICGHEHKGINPHTIDGNLFLNIGSLARVDRSSSMDKHFPKVLIGDIYVKNKEVKFSYKLKKIKVKKADDIFYEKEEANDFIDEIKSLAQIIGTDALEDVSSCEIIEELELSQDEINLLDEYIDNAREEEEVEIVEDYKKSLLDVKIKEVTLLNFKSHKNATVRFKEDFNLIVGENNVGKSTILKAINWVLNDTPKGDSFIRTGEDFCEVKVLFYNDNYIRKTRDKKGTTYYLYDKKENDEKTYKGTANRLPVELLSMHQSPKVKLFSKTPVSINYSDQLDPLFLIGISDSERAVAVGKITNTDIYDSAIKISSKDLLDLTKERKTLDKQIDNKELNIDELVVRDSEIDKLIKKAEKLKEKSDELEDDLFALEELEGMINDVYIMESSIKDINKVKFVNYSNVLKKIAVNVNFLETLEMKKNTYKSYDVVLNEKIELIDKSIIGAISGFVKNIKSTNITLKKISILEDVLNNKPVTDNLHFIKKITDIIKKGRILKKKINLINEYIDETEKLASEIDNLKNEEEELLKSLSKTTCPTCKRIIGK